MFDQAKATRAIRIMECLKLTGDFHGQPFRFQDWNRAIVSDVFGTMNERGLRLYRDVYVEVPKKNTKSMLGCLTCIKQLFDKQEPNGVIYFAGADKENARETLYKPLIEIIEQDPSLEKRVKITDSIKEITNKETGTVLKVLSSDVANKHGPNASLTVMDEIHSWHGRALYDILTHGTGLARREPLRIVLTTAGDDPDRVTIGWDLHDRAKSVIEARRPGGDMSKDIPTLYPVIFAYEGEDIWNEANWYTANPMLDVVFPIEALRELAIEAKLNSSNERLFRWLNLNQWPTTKLSNWLPLDLFDSTNATDWTRSDLLGYECYMGGDFSTTTDLSAICLVFPPQPGPEDGRPALEDWRVIFDCWLPADTLAERVKKDHIPYDKFAAEGWLYPTEGNVIDHTLIRDHILEMHKLYQVREFIADPSFARMLLTELQQEGVNVVEITGIMQSYNYLTDPMNYLDTLLRSHRTVVSETGQETRLPVLTHEPHPVARFCFGNTSVHKNGNAQIKYVKESKGKSIDRTKRIDLTVAWVLAMSRAKLHPFIPDLSAILEEGWGM